MYLGHGAYGVEAASRLYFNKSNKELTLEEAALIAGIFQTPERQSPFVDMKRATQRRNVVLQRMADERYITQAQADAAKQKPIVTRGQPKQPPGIAPFFVEEVRKHLERQYGAKALYENGLVGDDDARRDAAGMRRTARSSAACARYDKRHGYRQAEAQRRSPRGTRSTASRTSAGPGRSRAGDVVPAVVVTRAEDRRRRALRIGRYHADLAREGYAWTRRDVGGRPVQAGRSRSRSRSRSSTRRPATATVTLEQTPLVEGALVAIDNRTGQIKAMVGGWSFNRSKFNRAVQAYRQLGSTFKPIVYTAAIDRGFTPASILDRRAGQLSGGQRPDLQPAELRPQVRGPDHAALRARGVAQHPGDQDDGHARAEERARRTRSGSGSRRTSRRICRLRSAPATRRCSR